MVECPTHVQTYFNTVLEDIRTREGMREVFFNLQENSLLNVIKEMVAKFGGAELYATTKSATCHAQQPAGELLEQRTRRHMVFWIYGVSITAACPDHMHTMHGGADSFFLCIGLEIYGLFCFGGDTR